MILNTNNEALVKQNAIVSVKVNHHSLHPENSNCSIVSMVAYYILLLLLFLLLLLLLFLLLLLLLFLLLLLLFLFLFLQNAARDLQ
jgi:hypothetical protein